jgi:hypothetical protein
MAQIVHRPTVFDDQERCPFGIVLSKEYPYSETQGQGFDDPKDFVEDLFVTGFGFVISDVSKKLPHGLIFPQNGEGADFGGALCTIGFSCPLAGTTQDENDRMQRYASTTIARTGSRILGKATSVAKCVVF